MGRIIIEEIQKTEIISKVQEARNNGGRLVAINGYVDKDKNNVVVYTLEYDDVRKHYHVKGENELPTITTIYKVHNGLKKKYKKLCHLSLMD